MPGTFFHNREGMRDNTTHESLYQGGDSFSTFQSHQYDIPKLGMYVSLRIREQSTAFPEAGERVAVVIALSRSQ
jgi:hypothetical protein